MMATLTTERNTTQLLNGGHILHLPLKGKTTIYQGALVALDSNGFAVPGAKTSGLTAVGRAEETVANIGADGAAAINVQRGTFIFENTATAANQVKAAHVMTACYMEDDQTVTALATGASIAGRVIRVDPDGVAVEIGYGPLAAAAT